MELDHLLIGHWSSLPFAYGAMEASELGLLPDRRGWSTWFNFGALWVTRLSWACPEPGVVELHTKWIVEGTPRHGISPTASVEEMHGVTRHHYVVGPVVPMPGAEALLSISFEEPVEFSHRYARGRKEIRIEEDPAYLVHAGQEPNPTARPS
ncbi:hypothetical protein [Streptomyces sp. NBC_01465]|uniref:hypothetical protein n=1 Tax=Streptomyces sp. NBC_01465 TaxID=2903878 RepID=UPI002E3463A9|nr:hypothetical protein [Streptomyces sp. NBC_01465]